MVTKTSPTDTREQALQIQEAWTNTDASATYGGLTLADFQAGIAALETVEMTITNLGDQLTGARNDRHARRYALWDLIKRARAGVKATHGDDSDEYERFGGTRLSERKPRSSSPPEDPT
jgi:hypothetical protein